MSKSKLSLKAEVEELGNIVMSETDSLQECGSSSALSAPNSDLEKLNPKVNSLAAIKTDLSKKISVFSQPAIQGELMISSQSTPEVYEVSNSSINAESGDHSSFELGNEVPLDADYDENYYDDAEDNEGVESLSPNQVIVTLSYSLLNRVRQTAEQEGVSVDFLLSEYISEGVTKRVFDDINRPVPSHLLTRTGYVPPDAQGNFQQPTLSHHQNNSRSNNQQKFGNGNNNKFGNNRPQYSNNNQSFANNRQGGNQNNPNNRQNPRGSQLNNQFRNQPQNLRPNSENSYPDNQNPRTMRPNSNQRPGPNKK